MEKTLAVGAVKPCCKDAENLVLLPEESGNGLTVKQCRVCGCRHRRLKVEPGILGLTMKKMGR